jgi:spore maturation protein CgeB
MNPRAYELAAAGCFTISDYRAEVDEVFGALVPTFRHPNELRPLLDRWLADESGRARVRAALPTRVRDHTWYVRAAQIEADLQGAGIVARRAGQIRTPTAASA